MALFLNFAYGLALFLLSPWLLYKSLTTGKYRRGMWAKITGRVGVAKPQASYTRTVWFHGVSVGEVHLLRQVVARYRRRHPEHRVVVSSTTDTGYDEARKIFADLEVIWWPLDFSWAVQHALDAVQPDLVVLAEGELWPNFVRLAKQRGVKLATINARMSPKSAAQFLKLRWLVRSLFARLDLVAAQTDDYAANYRRLGALRVVTTGSVKYDGVTSDRDNPRTQSLRELFHIGQDELVLMAGSTQAPEEEVALEIYRRARARFPHLRLILVPRQKDRFDEVARLLVNSGVEVVRRSTLAHAKPQAVILLDTIGELSAAWGLADVAFVGGSLDGQRGGQNMIEPAGYGAAVVFGPHTWNFREPVRQLLAHAAAVQVQDAIELERAVIELLGNRERRRRLGEAAQRFVLSQQGATEKTLDALDGLLADSQNDRRAA